MYNLAFITLLFLSLGVAGYAVTAYSVFPLGAVVHPDMRPSFMNHGAAIYVHVFGAAFALVLGPAQFSARLRSTYPRLHRWLGRSYLAAGVLVGGLAGLWVSFQAFGGPVAKSGFAFLALAWLYTGFRAYGAARARDFAAHRRWMVRNFALTLAAVTLRIWLPASVVSGAPFEFAYATVAWLCWVPNLVIAELLFNRVSSAAIPAARAL